MANFHENDMVGSFKILEKIGEGGMAIIYKATQPSLKRTVVIKKLKDPNREIIERFKKEAFVSASFSQENVLAIYDFLYFGRSYYLVMEYVDGEDLRSIIDYTAPLPPYIAALIIREVAKGLEFTHSKTIIHRDIKPSNILISRQGEVKLIDFGVAKDETPSKLTMTGMIVGTPSYMSPEQANGDSIGKQSDIYSLGVLLYEMVTGVKPFIGDTNTEVLMKIIKGKFVSPKRYNQDLPWRLVRIIKRCMRKDTGKRYLNASELIRDLDKFIPWQEQMHKKEILSQFLRKFSADGYTSSATNVSAASIYAGVTPQFWILTSILILLFIFSGYQVNRFLQNERLVDIIITSNVSNNQVFINNNFLGNMKSTKSTFTNITAGNYKIKIAGPDNYGIYESKISLKPGNNVQIHANIPLRNTIATINATSEPSDANLYLDDHFLGKTPLSRLRLQSGAHKLRLEKSGFVTINDQLIFEKSQSYNLHYSFESKNSNINPAGN